MIRTDRQLLTSICQLLEELLAVAKHIDAKLDQVEDEEPDIDDEPPPDYGPPGTGAVITEYPF